MSVTPTCWKQIGENSFLKFSWWMFYLGFQYDSFDDWSNFFFNERFLADRVNLMRMWMEKPMFV